MKLSNWNIRKLRANTRAELFSYVPKHRAQGMELEVLAKHLSLFGREDLHETVVGELAPAKDSDLTAP